MSEFLCLTEAEIAQLAAANDDQYAVIGYENDPERTILSGIFNADQVEGVVGDDYSVILVKDTRDTYGVTPRT